MKGLYIHIPFCVKKCEYCDFVSYSGREELFSPYIDAVINEMGEYRGEEIDTIFIGGGTPSVLPPELIKKLCGAVRDNFGTAACREFTIEANPGTITGRKLSAMLRGGINRISIGIQSFNDRELQAAGRIHTAAQAYAAAEDAARAGFGNISADLMASLPLQTEESFKKSLETAVSLPLSHISVYSLVIEDGTPIRDKYDSGVYALPDEETDRRLYRHTKEFLAARGFERYEISNYALRGFESRHNLRYWDCGEYIGIGAAAASYINGVRFSNTPSLEAYISGERGGREREVLSRRDMMGEFMMLGLRKTAGVSAAEFAARFGCGMESVFGAELRRFLALGAMEREGGRYRLTERGLDVANAVMCEFLDV